MTGTNPEDPVLDEDKEVSEQDLWDLKYPKDGVEPPQPGADEPPAGDEPPEPPEETGEPGDQIDDEPPAEELPAGDEPPAPADFVKEFDYIKGDTPEEYARNLEKAYSNSTAEALRLKQQLEAPPLTPEAAPPEPKPGDDGEQPPDGQAGPTSPLELYAKQMLDKDITKAFDQFQIDYPQVAQKPNYDQFTRRVAIMSKAILDDEGRLAEPAELYGLAATSLGWDKTDSAPSEKEKLAAATKDAAATGKTGSAPGSRKPASKVTEEMIKVNQQMYPGKSREDIIKELEPHIT